MGTYKQNIAETLQHYEQNSHRLDTYQKQGSDNRTEDSAAVTRDGYLPSSALHP